MNERRTRRRPGENRARLQEAGLIEFGLFGFHGASTGAIAQRADVPQPHVYASFGSKQELFLACAEQARSELTTVSREASWPIDTAHGGVGAQRELVLSAFLLQAIAARQTPGLSAPLTELLALLRTELGEARWNTLVLTAAS